MTDDEKRPAGVCYCGTGPIDGEICDECSSGDSDIYRFVRMLVARDARIAKLEEALREIASFKHSDRAEESPWISEEALK